MVGYCTIAERFVIFLQKSFQLRKIKSLQFITILKISGGIIISIMPLISSNTRFKTLDRCLILFISNTLHCAGRVGTALIMASPSSISNMTYKRHWAQHTDEYDVKFKEVAASSCMKGLSLMGLCDVDSN